MAAVDAANAALVTATTRALCISNRMKALGMKAAPSSVYGVGRARLWKSATTTTASTRVAKDFQAALYALADASTRDVCNLLVVPEVQQWPSPVHVPPGLVVCNAIIDMKGDGFCVYDSREHLCPVAITDWNLAWASNIHDVQRQIHAHGRRHCTLPEQVSEGVRFARKSASPIVPWVKAVFMAGAAGSARECPHDRHPHHPYSVRWWVKNRPCLLILQTDACLERACMVADRLSPQRFGWMCAVARARSTICCLHASCC